MAFDVLRLRDEPLINRPYRQRRRLLEDLSLSGPSWCVPDVHIGDGQALFAATKAMGLEGVVAKRLDSRYQPGAVQGLDEDEALPEADIRAARLGSALGVAWGSGVRRARPPVLRRDRHVRGGRARLWR
jgi:hypothetical protein